MSDSLGGEEAGPGAGEPEESIPRSVTTSAGTVSYARPSSPLDRNGNGSGTRETSANGATARPMTPAERRRAKRLAYWSRPKPPKDWRYWVGGTGRVLITLGLLMFAFVAYQLWGTGIEEARAQNKLDNELEQRQAALGTVPILVPASTVAPDTTAPPQTVPGDTTPPATEAPTTAPPVLSLPPIVEGDAIGNLRIPRIDLDKNVVAGVSVPDLKKGPGHFPETPMPGELGNAAIAGHRTTYGGPFLHLDELEQGDEIVWVNLYKQEFVYRVTGSEIVKPSQGEVINTDDPTKATLVLITCDPVRTSKNRLVIHAELVEERSPTPTAGQEYYGQDVGSSITELPGDDTPEETTTATSEVEGTAPAAADTAATTAAPAGASADDADRPAGFSDTDPFAQGWFSDSAAWPHIIAWGFGLLVVVLGCYALARALKRRWVGWVVAVAPFTFLLYFFFQNVNRLLPPGL